MLDQVLHAQRLTLGHVLYLSIWSLVDLSDACGEEDTFELLEYGVNLSLALFEQLPNLGLLDVSPLAPPTRLILLKLIVELPKQVLIRSLLEETLELLYGVGVCLPLTFTQKVVDLIP